MELKLRTAGQKETKMKGICLLKVVILILAILFAIYLVMRNSLGFGNDLIIHSTRTASNDFNPFKIIAVLTYILHFIGFWIGIYILIVSIGSAGHFHSFDLEATKSWLILVCLDFSLYLIPCFVALFYFVVLKTLGDVLSDRFEVIHWFPYDYSSLLIELAFRGIDLVFIGLLIGLKWCS